MSNFIPEPFEFSLLLLCLFGLPLIFNPVVLGLLPVTLALPHLPRGRDDSTLLERVHSPVLLGYALFNG